MELTRITPLILTYNEEANIGRTLARLTWAERIVVVDSHSTDATREILKQHPQVDVFQRVFDHFAGQCNYGLEQIETEWVLSLDADYLVSKAFVQELRMLPVAPEADGYAAPFTYCVFGRPCAERSTHRARYCIAGSGRSTSAMATHTASPLTARRARSLLPSATTTVSP